MSGYVGNGAYYTILSSCIVNAWNLVIFTRKPFKNTLFGFYLRCLAIADILKSLGYVLAEINKIYPIFTDSNVVLCKLFSYLNRTLLLFSPWMLAIVAVDRAISINSIKANHIMQRKKWIKYTIVFITSSLLIFPEVYYIVYIVYEAFEWQNVIVAYTCYILPRDSELVFLISTINSAIFQVGIPFIVMTIANIISAVAFIRLKQKMKTERIDKAVKYVATTISLNFLFLVCESPRVIFAVIEIVYKNEISIDGIFTDFGNLLASVQYYYKTFYYIFPIIQLIFYIAFNTVYRAETLRLLRKIFCCCCRKKYNNSNNSTFKKTSKATVLSSP